MAPTFKIDLFERVREKTEIVCVSQDFFFFFWFCFYLISIFLPLFEYSVTGRWLKPIIILSILEVIIQRNINILLTSELAKSSCNKSKLIHLSISLTHHYVLLLQQQMMYKSRYTQQLTFVGHRPVSRISWYMVWYYRLLLC